MGVTAMRVLGLMMVRNGEEALPDALDAMAAFCDGVCVVVDRSTDASEAIVRRHPLVRARHVIPPGPSDAPWALGEDRLLTALYAMAGREGADWLVRLDCDERVVPGDALRSVLARAAPDVAAVRFPHVSTWDDPQYPDLVPLMGLARNMHGAAWRAGPGAHATKPLHNPRLPMGVTGTIVDSHEVYFVHRGWSTLAARVRRAEVYTALDPEGRWNYGVPYDEGLLFGYQLDQVGELIAEYRRRRSSFASPRDGV